MFTRFITLIAIIGALCAIGHYTQDAMRTFDAVTQALALMPIGLVWACTYKRGGQVSAYNVCRDCIWELAMDSHTNVVEYDVACKASTCDRCEPAPHTYERDMNMHVSKNTDTDLIVKTQWQGLDVSESTDTDTDVSESTDAFDLVAWLNEQPTVKLTPSISQEHADALDVALNTPPDTWTTADLDKLEYITRKGKAKPLFDTDHLARIRELGK